MIRFFSFSGITKNAGTPELGRRAENGGEKYFNGILDNIRIYNRALTPYEISQLYTPYFGPVITAHNADEFLCRRDELRLYVNADGGQPELSVVS